MEATDFLGNTLAVGDKVVLTEFEDWDKQSHNQVIKI